MKDFHEKGKLPEKVERFWILSDSDTTSSDETGQTTTSVVKESSGEKEKSPDEKMLPQSVVNELVGDTRKQARETGRNSVLKELGYESVEDLAKEIETARSLKEAQMSEVEKLQSQLETLKPQAEKVTTLEKEVTELKSVVEQTLETRKTQLDIPPYLQDVLNSMNAREALAFLDKHAGEIGATATSRSTVPTTGAGGKGDKKALTEEEKQKRQDALRRKYRIS